MAKGASGTFSKCGGVGPHVNFPFFLNSLLVLGTPVVQGNCTIYHSQISGAMDHLQQENSHPEDDQEEVFFDDSTFNNDSLFAIPAEDIPVEGAERSQTENIDQKEAFIDDSTFNNESLFAIPVEDIPVEGAAGNQTRNAEENFVENVAENENTNATDQLNEQHIDKTPY
ncbi:hypothetical protein BGX38DRAFT_1165557 [Terfezia claveryi]|nr:hypothetical protein BGX38DRAFT_1165557 [Terfezia claveryi]